MFPISDALSYSIQVQMQLCPCALYEERYIKELLRSFMENNQYYNVKSLWLVC